MAQVFVIGRVTADFEEKISASQNPYVRFDLAENAGFGEERRTQYYQVCAMGGDAGRLIHAGVKKGSLIWVSGSLSLEQYTRRDGKTMEKRMKILLDNWGYLPAGRPGKQSLEDQPAPPPAEMPAVIDGERESLPG